MKTKVVAKFVWYSVDHVSGKLLPVPHLYDEATEKYLFLDRDGYPSEEIAIEELLKFVGENIFRFEEFSLVKTYRVVSDD